MSAVPKRLARGKGAVGCALLWSAHLLLFQLSLQLATAVDGAVERGGKQAEGQKERQSEVDDPDGDVAAPGHVLDADDLHFRENAHGRRCDAQPEAAQKRHQGHVVPGNAIRLGDARMGVEGAAAHLQVRGDEP